LPAVAIFSDRQKGHDVGGGTVDCEDVVVPFMKDLDRFARHERRESNDKL
jgi:hypothetical protein